MYYYFSLLLKEDLTELHVNTSSLDNPQALIRQGCYIRTMHKLSSNYLHRFCYFI